MVKTRILVDPTLRRLLLVFAIFFTQTRAQIQVRLMFFFFYLCRLFFCFALEVVSPTRSLCAIKIVLLTTEIWTVNILILTIFVTILLLLLLP